MPIITCELSIILTFLINAVIILRNSNYMLNSKDASSCHNRMAIS